MILQHGFPKNKRNSNLIYSGSHIVGRVSCGVFHKVVSGSKHFLKQPPAIAFDISTLDDAEKAGANRVEVKDRETGHIYRAPISFIRKVGFPVNRGFGAQISLPMAYFSIDGQPPRNTPIQSAKPNADALQIRLF